MNILVPLIIHLSLAMGIPSGGMLGSEYFTIRYGPGEEGLARSVNTAAMKSRDIILDALGVAPDGPVMILLAPGGDGGFEAAQPGEARVPEWAVGTAYPRGRTIVIRHPDNLDFRFEDLEHVVIHEYTHIAVGSFLGDVRPPRWLDEGLATAMSGERSFTSSTTIGIAAITHRVIPFEQLDDYWPSSREQADLAYAESGDFISWIRTQYGPQALGAILTHYRESRNIDRSLVAVTGMPLANLEITWLKRVTRKYIWIPILTGGFSLWFVMSILVIIGYARKRRLGKLKIQLWELEDKMRAGLSVTSSDDEDDDDDDDEDDTPRPVLH